MGEIGSPWCDGVLGGGGGGSGGGGTPEFVGFGV